MRVTTIAPVKPINHLGQPIKKLYHVAAYCRVSTEQDEQTNSYEAQIEHYTAEISKNKDWVCAGIYADKGITGTDAKKRPEFQKMIKKCRQGKIDLVLVKSISRFARNTVECLEYIRELKSLGIGVIFEKENVNTLTETSEAMITIMGYFAQAESESISKNVTWGVRHGFSEGRVTFTCDIYGYKRIYEYEENGKRKKCEGKLEIIPEEAKVVREIFNLYLHGESTYSIAQMLTERGIKSPGNSDKWSPERVQRILRNEKYKGDVITQKTYCADLLTHRRVKNNGQLPQHYIENHHVAIIDRETFDAAQAEFTRRNAKKKPPTGDEEAPRKSKYSSKYALTELLICGQCGSPYRRCTWSGRGKRRIVWRCTTRQDYGKDKCPDSVGIDEYRIHNAILKALSNLADSKEHIRDEMKAVFSTVLINDGTDISLAALEAQLKEQENDLMRIVEICAERGNSDEFDHEFTRVSQSISDIRKIIEVEKTKVKPQLDIDSRIDKVFAQIDEASASMETFDNGIIRQLLAQVIVNSDSELTIILNNGYRFKTTMEERNYDNETCMHLLKIQQCGG